MSNHVPSTQVDISTLTMPEFVRLAEEVATTQTPRELVRHKKPLAVLMPTTKATPKKTGKTSIKEALALAGAWGERDWNEVEKELDRIRHQSKPTPPFEL